MKKTMILSGAAALVATGVAGADYTMTFEDFAAGAAEFTLMAEGGLVSGTLTGVTADFVLKEEGLGGLWADDLTVLIGGSAVQIGGFTDFGFVSNTSWGTGSSGAAGTAVVVNSLALSGGPVDVTGLDISLGNGWDSADSFGVWTGFITLEGITVVPAPGAIALLGLGGLVARRRRG